MAAPGCHANRHSKCGTYFSLATSTTDSIRFLDKFLHLKRIFFPYFFEGCLPFSRRLPPISTMDSSASDRIFHHLFYGFSTSATDSSPFLRPLGFHPLRHPPIWCPYPPTPPPLASTMSFTHFCGVSAHVRVGSVIPRPIHLANDRLGVEEKNKETR